MKGLETRISVKINGRVVKAKPGRLPSWVANMISRITSPRIFARITGRGLIWYEEENGHVTFTRQLHKWESAQVYYVPVPPLHPMCRCTIVEMVQ